MNAADLVIPSPDLPAGPRSALVVATTTYEDPQLRQLRAPATDAVELAAVLADPRIGGFDVTTVVNRRSQDVRLSIEEFLTGRRPEELVVVYLSCHGVTDARRRLHFATTDTARSRLASTGVDSLWVNDLLEQCRARRQILILDCCFSGAFARGAKGEGSLDLDQLVPPGRGRAVLTASNATEYSFESPAGGQPSPETPSAGSVFTAALVAGLRDGAADTNGDGYITVDEAYAYAYQEVRASGVAQTPQRWLTGGEGELVLARNRVDRAVVPAPLTAALHAALDSPLPSVRVGAVEELRHWLSSADPAKASTALTELENVAENDIPAVARHARSALESSGRAVGQGASGSGSGSGSKAIPTTAEGVGSPDRTRARRRRVVTALGLTLVLVTAVVMTAVALWPESLPSSEPLEHTELIVSMEVAGDFELFVADTRSPRPVRRLTVRPGADTAPVLSPDRKSLIYLHVDTSEVESLRVAGAADLSDDRVLFELPAGCEEVLKVAWNPQDTSMIALGCRDSTDHTTMRLMRTDGTVIRTVNPPSGRPRTGHLSFSHDGELLGFWASRNLSDDHGRLYTVAVDGGTPEEVFPLQDPAAEGDSGLDFSPDGERITFARLVDRHFDVMVAATSGADVESLTSGSQRDYDPTWSPDSRWLAYRSAAATLEWPSDDPDLRVWVMDRTGGDRRLLWPQGAPGEQRTLAWS